MMVHFQIFRSKLPQMWVESGQEIGRESLVRKKYTGKRRQLQMEISRLKRKMLWVVDIFLILRYPTSILRKRSCDFLRLSEIFEVKVWVFHVAFTLLTQG